MAEAALKEREQQAATAERMSLDAFLAWDDGTDLRYELVRGEVRAMAPTRRAHARLVAQLVRVIGDRLHRPCATSSGAGVIMPGRDDTFYIPDLVIDCGPDKPDALYHEAPRVIVEVLSDWTTARDRSAKLTAYRRMPSVEAILLVSARRRHIELWRRREEGWLVNDLWADEDEIVIEGLDLHLPLAAVYEGVALVEAEETAEQAGEAESSETDTAAG